MGLPDQTELLKLFSAFLFEAGLSAVSVKNYLSDLRHFLAFCTSELFRETIASPTVKDIFQNIDKYLENYLQTQRATFTPPSTTARRLASIRRFSTFLSVKFNISNIFTQQSASKHINRENTFETNQNISPTSSNQVTSANSTISSGQGLSSTKILEQFKTYLEKDKKSHSTVKNYLSDLNHFFLWTAKQTPFTDQNLVNILSEHLLSTYVTYLKLSHTSTSVINRRQSSIKKLAKFCFEQGFIPQNPFEIKSIPQSLAPLAWIERLSRKSKKPPAPKSGLAIIYDRYNEMPWAPYLNLALLVLATTAMAIFAYNQIIGQARPSAAATALTPPKRQLSFQGRLTDSAGTPITTAVSVVFKLFNALTGPTQLYTTGTCSITPDQDGIFNTLLGDGVCGAEINSSVFTDNRDVFLEITVGAETLTPRQQIATVGFALNSETLQGYPASASATINTVPVMNNDGQIVLGQLNPSIIATSSSGTFTIKGDSLAFQTNANSGGDIILQPDALGSGQILALGGTTAEDTFRITNANLTTGSLISGYVGNDTSTGRLISLTSGSTETDRFWVATDGRTSILASANDSSLIINQTGTGDLISASVSGTPVFTVTNSGNVDITGQYLVNGAPLSASNWQRALGSLTPNNITDSINIGAVATSAAYVHLAGTSGENSFVNTGNFGIGNISPAEKLDVTGNAHISGDVGIGTTGPDAKLDVLSTIEQLRLTYTDGTVYSAHTVDISGNLTINNTGTKTIIADDLQVSGGDILDSNGNESLRFGTTASSVNEATLTNAATGGIVTFAATGDDGDIALSIDAKGSDPLNLNNNGTGDILIGGGSGSTGCTITNATGALTCTVGFSASSTPFSGITSGSNTTAAMVVDTGASLDYAGSGTINASSLIGGTWAIPGTIGSSTPNTGAFTTLTSSGNSTIGTGVSLTNTLGSGASSINTIGSITTPGALTLHGATTLDNTFTVSGANLTSLGGDLLVSGTASISGALTLFGTPTINTTSNQPLTLSASDTIITGRTTLNGQSYTWPASQTNTYVLQTDGAGTLSWVPQSAGSSSSNWTIANGAIYPINATLDAFIGGDSTASAKFAFINVDSGTPTASISAGVAGATFLTADGNLSTTARQSLTLGNSAAYNTTGNILLSPNGTGNIGIGLTDPQYKLDVNGDIHIATGSDLYIGAIGLNDVGVSNITSGASLVGVFDEFANSNSTTVQGVLNDLDAAIAAAVTNDQFWESSNGALYPKNSTLDLLVGGQASDSAKFAFINVNSGTPTASISANTANNNTYLSGDGILATTNKQSLTLGSVSTGNINVGTDATARVLTLGNVTGATAVNVNTGTGGTTYTTTNGIFTLNTGTGTISLGTDAAAKTITVGNSTGATSIALNTGTGSSLNLGTNAIAHVVTIGNITGATAVNVNTGTAGTTYTTTNGIFTLNTGTGAISLGTDAAAKTITVGNSTGATSIALNTGTGSSLNLGTNAIDHVVTIGNITGATAVNVNTGTGGTTYTTTNGIFTLNTGTGAISLGTDAVAKTITMGNATGATAIAINSGTGDITLTSTDQIILNGTLSHTGSFSQSGGIIDLNVSSNFATNINTGSSTGAVTIGGGLGTVAVDSTSWDISTTGVASGFTGFTSSGTINFSGLTASRAVFTDASSNLVSTGNSAMLLNTLTDETGTLLAVFSDAPTFTTSITDPLVIGGAAVGSSLSLRSTSAVGTTDFINFQVGSNGGTEAMRIIDNGNVGIGDTSPASLFTVGSGDLFQVDTSGNVSIDNQSDLRLLEADANGSNYTGFQAPAILGANLLYTLPSAQGAASSSLVNDGAGTLSWFNPTGGTGASGYWTRTVDSLYPTNITDAIGLGFSTALLDASAILEVDGNISPHNTGYNLGNSGKNWGDLYLANDIVVGNTSTISLDTKVLADGQWNVNNLLRVGDATKSMPTVPVASLVLDVEGAATVSGALGTNSTLYVKGDSFLSGTVSVGGGAGKLDAGTVDPPYTINGEKYATYMAGMVGVKEETTGKVNVSNYINGLGYRALIELDQQPTGSDLWLFAKTTQIKSNLDRLSVLLTAEGQSKTWYEIDPQNNILAIYSSTPANVTYRLTAPRFDSASWSNTRTGDSTGFVLNEIDFNENTPGTGLLGSIIDPELIAEVDNSFTLKINGRQTHEVSSFFQSIIANLTVGTQVVTNLVADNLTIRTKLISPIADIDQLKVIDATVSGTLYADNIKSRTVDNLTLQLDLLNEKYATASSILAGLQAKYTTYDSLFGEINTATISGDPLALSPLATTSAVLPSDLALNSLSVHTIYSNDIMANGSIFTQTISSFEGDLYIQPTGDKPVHLLANLMTLYPDGKVVINGDLLITGIIYASGLDTKTATVSGMLALGRGEVASDSGKILALFDDKGQIVGSVDASGSANFGQLTTGGLVIASGNDSLSASISAQINSNTTIGTATIASNSAEIAIANNKVTDHTLIYLTPISDTSNQVLYVKSKQSGVGFTVAVPALLINQVSFNYWLVETK